MKHQLADKSDISPNQVNKWHRQMLDNADTVFGSAQGQQKSDEAHLKDLHVKIGQPTLENDFYSCALDR